jgi:hypothetical protein
MTKGLLVWGRRCTRWTIVAAFAIAMAWPVATGGADTNRTAAVPTKLLGVWHKTMTRAEWERAGVYRDVGVYTFVIKKTGAVTVYKPGEYRTSCGSSCSDFTTTFRLNGGRLTLGSVPVCSFQGVYSWPLHASTLIVRQVAATRCVVRETFFGGRWKR